MKRLCFLVVLMVLSSSAYAGSSLFFVVGGHRIRIEARVATQWPAAARLLPVLRRRSV